MIERNIPQKVRDQVALWILLEKLQESGFKTHRLKLQKMVYLADILGVIGNKKPTNYTFRVYKYGPFSREIVSDIDKLVSIDAVNANNADWSPECERSFEYEINNSQLKKVFIIEKLPHFKILNDFMELVVQATGHLNGEQIKKLVYSEPNYLSAKTKGFGSKIDTEYTFALRYKELSKKITYKNYGIELRDEEIIWLFLNYLNEVSKHNFTGTSKEAKLI